MEFIFLGLLFLAGFIIIPVLLFLGFVLLKILFFGIAMMGLIIMFTGGLGFMVVAGFVVYLFFYWLFAERQNT